MKRGCFRTVITLVLFALFIVVIGPKLLEAGLKVIYPKQYTEIVERNAAQYQLDPELVYAVIHTESKFKEDAESSAGAKGLMQLTQQTYDWVLTHNGMDVPESGDIWLPENNIKMGCALIRFLWDHYGSQEVALSAYNAGMGNVSGWLEKEEYSSDGKTLHTIPYPETEKYVEKVQKVYDIYQQVYGK